MNWNREFISQNYGRPLYKHGELPVYITDEFDFYRCVEFKDEFYGKTASCLFSGNLRESTGRYSKLFPNQKISYWADSPATARAEIKKHGAGSDILTFWAYDDGSSTFPILQDHSPLIIIDGRKCGVQDLLDKVDKNTPLTKIEQELLISILAQNPDCLAFNSRAKSGGENFIFFEKGFRKLALRQLRIRFGQKKGGAHNQIICANTSDYSPCIKSYGKYFMPKAKVAMDQAYLESDEYSLRKQVLEKSYRKMQEGIK